MEPKYIYAESMDKPAAVEVCKNTVYLRTDISEKMRTDASNDVIVYWSYMEATLTTEEFNTYANLVLFKNGITDSGNISQLVVGQENADNNQLVIMEAIADLYDVVAMMM